MSRSLTLQLSEEAYAELCRQAEAVGAATAHWVAAVLERQYGAAGNVRGRGSRWEEELQAARERFERHFGELNLGQPVGVDNEQIDADLAAAYAETHAGYPAGRH